MENERMTINEEPREATEGYEGEEQGIAQTEHLDDETDKKEVSFKNSKSACECFGYNEEVKENWAVCAMAIWHKIITGFWLALGMLTFAPVTFISRKLEKLIETTWIRLVSAIGIYVLIALAPFWIKLFINTGA